MFETKAKLFGDSWACSKTSMQMASLSAILLVGMEHLYSVWGGFLLNETLKGKGNYLSAQATVVTRKYRMSRLTRNLPRQHAAAAAGGLPEIELVTMGNIAVAFL
jgi:hypothetical protein